MQEKLKEKDEIIDFDDKSLNKSVIQKTTGQKTEFHNPISILKLRLNKFIATNKEKKKLID